MIHFCNQCGHAVEHTIPAGDNAIRAVCPACKHIQYENPRVIVGCLIEHEQKILLCRRAIEPRLGYWTLPAGFMENGESTQEGAAREAREEACAEVHLAAPLAMISIAQIDQVHLFYRGTLASPHFAPGEESLDVQLFDVPSIPWDELAFSSVRYCLQHYLADKAQGSFGFHETSYRF